MMITRAELVSKLVFDSESEFYWRNARMGRNPRTGESVEVVARHEPDEALRGRYEAMYGIYRDSARATADINHRLAAVERG